MNAAAGREAAASRAPFFFDPGRLGEIAARHKEAYAGAEPFPHVVLDDFMPREVAEGVLAEFPRPGEVPWHFTDKPFEKKLSAEEENHIPPFTRQVLHAFNSSTFVTFLEEMTGITGLIPDPHFRGGGMHQIERGGRLGIHADFNHYPRLNLQRRLNALLYLNKDWKEEYGGHIQLWDRKMRRCVKKALPVFNRMVVFTTTDYALHGHPDPLTCPEGWTRKSLALYYYTVGRPLREKAFSHSTLFVARPGSTDAIPKEKGVWSGNPLRKAAHHVRLGAIRFLPSFLVEAIRAVKRALRRP